MYAKTNNLIAWLGLSVGLFQVIAAQDPYVQLHIDQTCEDISKSGLSEYILYTNPQDTSKCITFGAPGFPFFSTTPGAIQCGDYTKGGADYGPCNSYPKNAPAVTAGDGTFYCKFWTSEDCGISGGDAVWNELHIKPSGPQTCADFPPQLPFSGGAKQTASSMVCVNS